jgi:hypothetical protein
MASLGPCECLRGRTEVHVSDPAAQWWRLVEHIAELEELIAELGNSSDDSTTIAFRTLTETLHRKQRLLKSIDIGLCRDPQRGPRL